MTNALKEILVVDVECAQNNDNNKDNFTYNIPKYSISEVGITRYIPATGEIIVDENEDLFVYDVYDNKPPTDQWNVTDYSKINQMYTFKEISDLLQYKYRSKRYTWMSWGNFDKDVFIAEAAHFNHTGDNNYYPFGPNHINLKLLFSLKEGLTRQQGMAYALKRINEPLEGTHHRGRDDAYNIAKILRYVMRS